MVQSLAACCEKLFDSGPGSNGLEKLQLHLADSEERHLQAAIDQGLPALEGCSERAHEDRKDVIDAMNGDANVRESAGTRLPPMRVTPRSAA